MAKEVGVAAYFGRGDLVDAFLFAYLLPGFLVLLFASSLNAALMPTLVRLRESKGANAAHQLFWAAVLFAQAGLILVCLLLTFAGPTLLRHIASGFTPEKLLLTQHLFWAMLPLVLSTGLATNCAAYLNTMGSFALPAVTPALAPIITLILLVTPARHWGAWALAAGLIAGSLIETAILLVALFRRGVLLGMGWHGGSAVVVGWQYAAVCGAALLSSGAGLLDQSMATLLPSGSVAALAYGGRVVACVVALVSTSVSTAVMPFYSEAIAKEDWEACRAAMRRVSRLLFAVTIPATVLLISVSGMVARLLYQHGAFTASDTALVARVQSMYALELPFYGVAPVYLRFLVALRRSDVIMAGAAINLGLDFILNLIGMRLLGVAGLALSTSIFYAFSFVFLRHWASRLLQKQTSLRQSLCLSNSLSV